MSAIIPFEIPGVGWAWDSLLHRLFLDRFYADDHYGLTNIMYLDLMFTDIFNISLLLSVVPICLRRPSLSLFPKSQNPQSQGLLPSSPDSLDSLQVTYRPNRSTDGAMILPHYTALSHLDQRDTYIRMLFID